MIEKVICILKKNKDSGVEVVNIDMMLQIIDSFKEAESEQYPLIIPAVIVPKGTLCVHKAKVLTKKEVEDGRSNAYKYLDLQHNAL